MRPVRTAMTESGPHDPWFLPRRWEILHSPAADGVTNMALDAALLDTVRDGVAVWRWYGWETPTVSFGRNERVRGRFDAASVAAAGLAAVRRPTGGRALLHSQELTYSVTLPLSGEQSWRPTYAAINAVLWHALHRLGVPAQLSPGVGAVRPDGPVCFDAPAEGEIVVAGRKLVGSAVWRQGNGYLQHGSLLFVDDQARLATAARVPLPPAPPAASLMALLPGRSAGDLTEAVMTAVRETLATVVDLAPYGPSAALHLSTASHIRHLTDAGWLWRR